MRIAIVVLVGLLGMGVAGAKPKVASKVTLVQAQCEGPPTGPCSDVRFVVGNAELFTSKQPGPTCPKTGKNTENVGGTVKLSDVRKGFERFNGTLFAEVTYKTTFGADPNGNCSLAGVQITTPSLQADLVCSNGKCKGTLYAIACLEKGCADTPVTSELVTFIVYDGPAASTTRLPLAVPGTFIAPGKADAS